MELRQLGYVVAVAEQASFTRAAAQVHVAQPAISQQVAQLERELGERLFDRSERRIRLTPAGESFLPHARAALAAAAAGRDAVAVLHGVLAGQLTVGTIPSPPPLLLDRLASFRNRHPRVRLQLRTGDPERLAAEVASGALDTALIGVSGPRLVTGPAGQWLPAALASADFAHEPLVIAVAPTHPLARSEQASISDLRGQPLVTLAPGTGLRTELEAACAAAGFTPEIAAETDDLAVLADLAGHGFGAALIPRSAADRPRLGLTLIPLRLPAPDRPMVLVWHRERISAASRAFVEHATRRADA
jgi:DNA-binding transcriptional LysR family regulator